MKPSVERDIVVILGLLAENGSMNTRQIYEKSHIFVRSNLVNQKLRMMSGLGLVTRPRFDTVRVSGFATQKIGVWRITPEGREFLAAHQEQAVAR